MSGKFDITIHFMDGTQDHKRDQVFVPIPLNGALTFFTTVNDTVVQDMIPITSIKKMVSRAIPEQPL